MKWRSVEPPPHVFCAFYNSPINKLRKWFPQFNCATSGKQICQKCVGCRQHGMLPNPNAWWGILTHGLANLQKVKGLPVPSLRCLQGDLFVFGSPTGRLARPPCPGVELHSFVCWICFPVCLMSNLAMKWWIVEPHLKAIAGNAPDCICYSLVHQNNRSKSKFNRIRILTIITFPFPEGPIVQTQE